MMDGIAPLTLRMKKLLFRCLCQWEEEEEEEEETRKRTKEALLSTITIQYYRTKKELTRQVVFLPQKMPTFAVSPSLFA